MSNKHKHALPFLLDNAGAPVVNLFVAILSRFLIIFWLIIIVSLGSTCKNKYLATSLSANDLTWDGVDAAIDDNGTWFNPGTTNHFRLTNGHHQDVSFLDLKFKSCISNGCNLITAPIDIYRHVHVFRLRVANRNRCIVPLEQLGHRSAHDLTAPDDDSVRSCDGNSASLDQFHAAIWGAR